MAKYLFRIRDDGRPLPALPFRCVKVEPREADGVEILTVEQAAAATGYSPGRLRDLWASTYPEYAADAPAGAGGEES